MALYTFPEILKSVSPALPQQMQGKSCFNFTRIEAQLFAELERLTAAGAKGFAVKTTRLTGNAAGQCGRRDPPPTPRRQQSARFHFFVWL